MYNNNNNKTWPHLSVFISSNEKLIDSSSLLRKCFIYFRLLLAWNCKWCNASTVPINHLFRFWICMFCVCLKIMEKTTNREKKSILLDDEVSNKMQVRCEINRSCTRCFRVERLQYARTHIHIFTPFDILCWDNNILIPLQFFTDCVRSIM